MYVIEHLKSVMAGLHEELQQIPIADRQEAYRAIIHASGSIGHFSENIQEFVKRCWAASVLDDILESVGGQSVIEIDPNEGCVRLALPSPN